jgi:hypothetical protein
MHPSDGTLRRSLDEPFAIDARARGHVATCGRCAQRITVMGSDAAFASAALAVAGAPVDLDAARARLAATEAAAPHAAGRRSLGWHAKLRLQRSRASRVVVGRAVAATASTVLVVSGGAQDFLSLFQPTQFAAVPVSDADIRSLAGLTSYGTVNGATSPLTLKPEPDAAAAGQAADMAPPSVTAPAGTAAAPRYAVINGTVVSFTFNAALAQAAAARAGGQLPPMPAGLDGSTLTVTIAPAVVIAFGLDPGALYSNASLPASGSAFVVLASRTPTVSSTGVTVETLENYLLSVPGIPAGVVAEIRAIGDPSRTVPVPIPIDFASASIADINGSRGLLIGDSTGLGTVLLWQHNHVVYAVAGTISSDTALGIARSVH